VPLIGPEKADWLKTVLTMDMILGHRCGLSPKYMRGSTNNFPFHDEDVAVSEVSPAMFLAARHLFFACPYKPNVLQVMAWAMVTYMFT
jgi:hypothetical protein